MASDYLPVEIEKKWQERWAAEKLYQVRDDGRMVGGSGGEPTLAFQDYRNRMQ